MLVGRQIKLSQHCKITGSKRNRIVAIDVDGVNGAVKFVRGHTVSSISQIQRKFCVLAHRAAARGMLYAGCRKPYPMKARLAFSYTPRANADESIDISYVSSGTIAFYDTLMSDEIYVLLSASSFRSGANRIRDPRVRSWAQQRRRHRCHE